MSMRSAASAAVSLSLVVVAASCSLSEGPGTVISNRSSNAMVIAVDIAFDTGGIVRYHASAPGSDVIVDTVGEANPATPWVDIYDVDCRKLLRLSPGLSNGGTITLRDGQSPLVETGRLIDARGWPGDLAVGDDTCEAAAARVRLKLL